MECDNLQEVRSSLKFGNISHLKSIYLDPYSVVVIEEALHPERLVQLWKLLSHFHPLSLPHHVSITVSIGLVNLLCSLSIANLIATQLEAPSEPEPESDILVDVISYVHLAIHKEANLLERLELVAYYVTALVLERFQVLQEVDHKVLERSVFHVVI